MRLMRRVNVWVNVLDEGTNHTRYAQHCNATTKHNIKRQREWEEDAHMKSEACQRDAEHAKCVMQDCCMWFLDLMVGELKVRTHTLTHRYSTTPSHLTNLFMYSSAKASHPLQTQRSTGFSLPPSLSFFLTPPPSSPFLLQVMGDNEEINITGNKRPASWIIKQP